MKNFVVAAVLMTVATPAMAAEFYVLQDPTTKKCNVEKTKPEGMIIIGSGPYGTKVEAKAAKDAAPECNPPASPSGQ